MRVDVTDDMQLREVLLGELGSGKNYAVLCHKEDSKIPVSSVFQDANDIGKAPAEFRLIDCDYVLPESEKSIADRFKLKLKDRPTVFVSGASGEPKQVSESYVLWLDTKVSADLPCCAQRYNGAPVGSCQTFKNRKYASESTSKFAGTESWKDRNNARFEIQMS